MHSENTENLTEEPHVPELCQELQSQLPEQPAPVLHKCHQSIVEK